MPSKAESTLGVRSDAPAVRVGAAMWRVDVLVVAGLSAASLERRVLRALHERIETSGPSAPVQAVSSAEATDDSAPGLLGASMRVGGDDADDAVAVALDALDQACVAVIGRHLPRWEVRVVPAPQ